MTTNDPAAERTKYEEARSLGAPGNQLIYAEGGWSVYTNVDSETVMITHIVPDGFDQLMLPISEFEEIIERFYQWQYIVYND